MRFDMGSILFPGKPRIVRIGEPLAAAKGLRLNHHHFRLAELLESLGAQLAPAAGQLATAEWYGIIVVQRRVHPNDAGIDLLDGAHRFFEIASVNIGPQPKARSVGERDSFIEV